MTGVMLFNSNYDQVKMIQKAPTRVMKYLRHLSIDHASFVIRLMTAGLITISNIQVAIFKNKKKRGLL